MPILPKVVEFFIYLYFGKTHDDLKSFTLRDLKIVRINEDTSFKSRFMDAHEARACFYYSNLLKQLRTGSAAAFERGANELSSVEDCPSEYARRIKAKAILKIGQFFGKQRAFHLATRIYQLSDSDECNERAIRLEYSHGDKERAKSMLERMIEDPASDDEYDFAEREPVSVWTFSGMRQ